MTWATEQLQTIEIRRITQQSNVTTQGIHFDKTISLYIVETKNIGEYIFEVLVSIIKQ